MFCVIIFIINIPIIKFIVLYSHVWLKRAIILNNLALAANVNNWHIATSEYQRTTRRYFKLLDVESAISECCCSEFPIRQLSCADKESATRLRVNLYTWYALLMRFISSVTLLCILPPVFFIVFRGWVSFKVRPRVIQTVNLYRRVLI